MTNWHKLNVFVNQDGQVVLYYEDNIHGENVYLVIRDDSQALLEVWDEDQGKNIFYPVGLSQHLAFLLGKLDGRNLK